ncbi:uncharacterized protein LOC118804532 [Colossoma macropomum]|uniref:uncharacterized protein LOC118804532 n=1 Tax=Colossoma macropomum TaxID=42526 RepID=UPI0018655E53|nr:uncharacterized protein LOC118804532 [Colossoma macropomum]
MGFLTSLWAPLLLLISGGVNIGQSEATSYTPTFDPCNKYTSLDQPWRANNETGLNICDKDFNWNGWYRLLYYGMNIRLSESCVPTSRCGTYYTLWLNGPHPQIQDGVVTRQVCGNGGSDCCYIASPSIQVKACPGNYYVYKLVSPSYCNMAYCTDVNTITPTTTDTGSEFSISITSSPTNYSFDPCNNYSVVDDYWRNTRITDTNYRGHDDTVVEWKGWYRLYIEGKSAKIAETVWCERYRTCGGYSALWLGGSHPRLEDGIVTREIYKSYNWYNWYWYNGYQCSFTTSKSIQVKACPGDYYVYKLVQPDVSIPMPTYCAVAFRSLTYDPCHNYLSLDQPWRANNETGLNICDRAFNWNGWYRLFYYGMNIRMAESCVPTSRCGAYYSLWLNGPHPQLEDGVVTRQVCGNGGSDCCSLGSTTIRVKACPGNYYVYELVSPIYCNMAYCTDVSSITPLSVPATVAPGSDWTASFDPCYNYTVLDDDWRNAHTYSWSESDRAHDDTLVEWNGWYRLYLQGANAQIPEMCVSFATCGGCSQLWLNGSHPRLEDGIVTRKIYGTSTDFYSYIKQCIYRHRSKPIQVKACPGNYYVYRLVKPELSIPMPTYCAVAFDNVTDPCYNYISLDQPWRANNETALGISDEDFNWNGWYRLFYYGMDIRMAESCVPTSRCGSYNPLWLNGPHPQIEDGVVTRQVCGNGGSDCCYYHPNPIRIKACPGNYYVYEFLNPTYYNTAYCTDVNTITQGAPPTTEATDSGFRTTTPTNNTFDPCNDYTVLDDDWRNASHYYYVGSRGHDDTTVEWNGWYRLFFQGASAQISEGCVHLLGCAGYTLLWLSGSHPQPEDGIVTREIYGSTVDESYEYQCKLYRSKPIQVKACPGHYYVYKLVKPDVSIPMPTYCTVTFTNPSYDPCNNYNELDDQRRGTNFTYNNLWWMGDSNWNWNGWYRLLYKGNNIRMPESCVNQLMCGANVPLWLNGSHPRLEDGVVTRQVCGSWNNDCCYYNSYLIQVKACPGNYYVYEFVNPAISNSAYCADVDSISPAMTPEIPETTAFIDSIITTESSTTEIDPPAITTAQLITTTESSTTEIDPPAITTAQLITTTESSTTEIDPPANTTPQLITTTDSSITEIDPPAITTAQLITTTESSTTEIDPPAITTAQLITTTARVDPCVELNCTEDEWCGERDGIYGCFCNDNRPKPRNKTYDSRETCESSSGTMSLSRCQLFEAGFPANVLHLSDPSCNGTLQNGRLVFHFDNDDHICGTNLTANGTHFIYENTIQGVADSAGGPINRKKHLELRFSCIYQLSQTLTMDTVFNPLLSIVHKTLPDGQGLYQVRMKPYQDAAFSHPYNGIVDIEVDQRIYVEVIVQGVDSRQIATVIDSCWATPVNDQNYAVQWNLINKRCPNSGDPTVKVLQNGVSTIGRFSFKMFAFNGNYSKVFLHCSIHLCLLQHSNCAVNCSPKQQHRAARSVDTHDRASISVGPFIWTAGSTAKH